MIAKRKSKLSRTERALLSALKDTLKRFDAEVHDQYDGTSMLKDRLAEVDEARALISRIEAKL